MKQILIACLLMLAVGVNAQKVYFGSDTDTITTSSSIDTIDFWLGGTSFSTAQYFKGDGFLTVQLVSDSLSGATAANAYLEYFYGNSSSAIPYRAETFTALNGSAQQNQMKEETQLAATRVRVRVISASGTQSTRLRMNWVYKED